MDDQIDFLHKLSLVPRENDLENFIGELSHVIKKWLDKGELEKLYSYLYRIDVNEYYIEKTMRRPVDNMEKGRLIAELMIARQSQKLNKGSLKK